LIVANKGGNKGREADKNDASRRSEDTAAQNRRDEAVSRDPDIRGVNRKFSRGPHKRDAQD
jgi:hypothetical protein